MHRRISLLCLVLLAVLTGHAQQPSPQPAPPNPDPTRNPVEFLERVLAEHERRGIEGYTARFDKRERIAGKLQEPEEIDLALREKSFAVFMRWLKGARKATAVLFAEGENGDQLLARPAGLAGSFVSYVRRDVDGEEARQSGRYTLREVGLKRTTLQTLKAWKAARDRGELRVEYLGRQEIAELDKKPCHVLRRTCVRPEDDGVVDGVFYFDVETLQQVGTVVRDANGELIGYYYYRALRLNPRFKPDQFKAPALAAL